MHAYIVLVLHLDNNLVNVCEVVERKKNLKVNQAGYLDNYQVFPVVWKMEDGKAFSQADSCKESLSDRKPLLSSGMF